MSDEEPGFVYRTKTGRLLTEADIEQLAKEAEEGYDVEPLLRKRASHREYAFLSRFFRSALFPLLMIALAVYIATQLWGGS